MEDWQTRLQLDGQGAVYEQIKRVLESQIVSGVWSAGERVPGEEELAAHFGTARMTVHRALRELTDGGFIVRRRRAGSFVAAPPSPAAVLEIADMSKTIPARGQKYRYECLRNETVRASREVAESLRLEEAARVQYVLCRHLADGMAVELEERWINLDILPAAEHANFTSSAPGSWLLSVAGWTEAEHTISALNADTLTAEQLDMDEGAACLVLERRTFQQDQVVTFARLTHPGQRHRFTQRFSPK